MNIYIYILLIFLAIYICICIFSYILTYLYIRTRVEVSTTFKEGVTFEPIMSWVNIELCFTTNPCPLGRRWPGPLPHDWIPPPLHWALLQVGTHTLPIPLLQALSLHHRKWDQAELGPAPRCRCCNRCPELGSIVKAKKQGVSFTQCHCNN